MRPLIVCVLLTTLFSGCIGLTPPVVIVDLQLISHSDDPLASPYGAHCEDVILHEDRVEVEDHAVETVSRGVAVVRPYHGDGWSGERGLSGHALPFRLDPLREGHGPMLEWRDGWWFNGTSLELPARVDHDSPDGRWSAAMLLTEGPSELRVVDRWDGCM